MRYCIGDIHGCYKTFKKLVDQILKVDNEAKFYLVGDLIDRGPATKRVLDYSIQLLSANTIVGIVKGNHEQMLVDAYEKNCTLQDSMWYANKANTTVKEFDKSFSDNQKVNELIPQEYYLFFKKLPYYIELEDYFIVHAGFNLSSDLAFTDYQSMIWIRDMLYDHIILKEKKVIHGHTPILVENCEQQIKQNKIINIDTGCVFTQYKGFGFLSALNIDTMELISIYNVDIL